MAEFANTTAQTVTTGANVLFGETVIAPTKCITHRTGSGLVTLRGIGTQCRARYKVYFGGNVAIPTGGALGAISLSIALNGEPLSSTSMIVTPSAVEEYFNVGACTYVDVCAGCCSEISVQNTSTETVSVQNANLIVERVA